MGIISCKSVQNEVKEVLIKSAAVDGERFFVKTRFEKRWNTVCISRFSNRRIGGKDPSSAVGDLFRGSLRYDGYVQSALRLQIRNAFPERALWERKLAGKTLRCFCGKIGNARQAQASGLAQRRKALSTKSSKNTLSRSTLSSISSSMRFQRNCTKKPMKA